MKRGPRSAPETHPGTGVLLDFIENRLGADARGQLKAHLKRCDACRGDAAVLERIGMALRAEAADQPPADLTRWAAALATPETTSFPKRPALLRIVTDSWGSISEALKSIGSPLIPAPALRSPNGNVPRLGRRRVLLSTSSCDLDLEIDYTGFEDPRRVHGQILPSGGTRILWKGSEIRLVTRGRAVARARADRRGEFLMNRVRPGSYRIEIQGPACSASSLLEV